MTTEKQREAARANGAKSRGPVTAEGKARSSKNATTHGLTAATVLLPGESEERFFALIESMLQAYAPADGYQVSVVERMAALSWQQDRLLGIDTMTLAIQMEMMAPALDTQVEDLSIPARIAFAYRELSDASRVLPNLDRHASRIRRQFNQLRAELLALQKTCNENLQNEPSDTRASSNSGSCLPSPDSSGKLQNEPTNAQPASPEQLATAQQASSDSDARLPSPDSSQKLQNEPGGEQPTVCQSVTGPDARPDGPLPLNPAMPAATPARRLSDEHCTPLRATCLDLDCGCSGLTGQARDVRKN